MTKPPSIWMFERVLLAATLVEGVNHLVSYPAAQKAFSDPALAQIGLGIGTYLAVGLVAPFFAVLVWFYIARRASPAARALYVTLVVLSVGAAFQSLTTTEFLLLTRYIQALSLGLHSYAAWLLFRPDSRVWFGRTARV